MMIDYLLTDLYIRLMNNNTTPNFEADLKRLEDRLDDLVKICDRLQSENKSLKEQQDSLSKERATLLQKNEQIRTRVEAMISRLKSMEQGN
jgi:cell division protein ZapB|tara:strand:- start:40115 stop:40387 length:273 start_codon:yes stop_codon:yes gene_type:complete